MPAPLEALRQTLSDMLPEAPGEFVCQTITAKSWYLTRSSVAEPQLAGLTVVPVPRDRARFACHQLV